jgi:hypothetical protein
MSGHDHDLQFITRQSDPANADSAPVWPAFVVSGAGSAVRNNEFGQADRKVSSEACIQTYCGLRFVECICDAQHVWPGRPQGE